jgi:BirA family transcriptional regulator, biotin operon repressor / biotin---[acetyl-CoA-carboxylase] ligase
MQQPWHITVLPQIDSTNNYAIQQIHASLAKPFQAFLALSQTAGRGQYGKTWQSPNAVNVYLTAIIANPCLPLLPNFYLSKLVAIASLQTISQYLGNAASVKIKWPNDILVNHKKIAGILIEYIKPNWAVIGLGLNVNQTEFSKNLSQATSLKIETTEELDILAVTDIILKNIAENLDVLNTSPQNITAVYHQYLYGKNEKVSFNNAEEHFTEVIKMVDDEGYLITENHKIKHGDYQLNYPIYNKNN